METLDRNHSIHYIGIRLTNTQLIVPVRSRAENAFFPRYNRHCCGLSIFFSRSPLTVVYFVSIRITV